nr:hypothetical protein [Tanacetum cinerariifolium]
VIERLIKLGIVDDTPKTMLAAIKMEMTTPTTQTLDEGRIGELLCMLHHYLTYVSGPLSTTIITHNAATLIEHDKVIEILIKLGIVDDTPKTMLAAIKMEMTTPTTQTLDEGRIGCACYIQEAI